MCWCVRRNEAVSFYFGLQYKLTSAINKSEERRELPTIPQPTNTIEWLARTSFRHCPVRFNVPQQRKHNVPQKRKPRLLGDVVCSSLTPPLLCTEGATLVLKAACTCVETLLCLGSVLDCCDLVNYTSCPCMRKRVKETS